MPAIQNVERRGAVYYWRRTVRFPDGKPFTIRLSLKTRDQSIARCMGCAMTAKSETLKMKLGHDRRTRSLTTAQKSDIFRKALEEMRDELDRNHVCFQQDDPANATYLIEGLVEIYETMLRDFVVHGIPADVGSREHIEARFAGLSEEQRETLTEFFADRPSWREKTLDSAGEELDRVVAPRTDESLALARKVALEGKLAAAMEFRRRLGDPMSMWSQVPIAPPPVADVPSPNPPALATATMPAVEEPWASMSSTQAAARFITDNPKITGDARRKARWTSKTRSQFEAAARLLEKSCGSKPLRLLTREDVVTLNQHFAQLPKSHHKSSRHHAMSLEEICREAEDDIAAGARDRTSLGLGATTTNRHFLFLKELVGWFSKQVPGTEDIPWSDFIYEDDRDAREQRDAYTEEEGRKMFRLPIWIGSRSVSRRMEIGTEIWHDAGYWVVLIAWYTGCRREEICQLTLDDIGQSGNIWYFTITDENGGRVKNRASKRDVPFAEELIRLGLPAYVEALRAAGERMLFPELRTETGNRGYGDVYYKNWWTKIAKRLDFIVPGQALHSFRHMVTTELKFQHVYLEDRADLIGHATPGETAGRYSKAARLARLKEAVDQIPKVTDRMKPASIRLLPADRRTPRPTREVSRKVLASK
ncbi:site-specific integrase [uncultured Sphingomonas sp.]|uniref:site-specific integrase n=1 Tax=uncultured Sphingomonas sp. TaxID=158754 RepID=UPI0025E5F694|nr:site-specific integrase [uncultured Sphingomonas sp.]